MTQGEGAGDQALEVLKHNWDGAYEIGLGLDGYWARRRDGLGETMIHVDPEVLRGLLWDDYGMKPVPRTGGDPR